MTGRKGVDAGVIRLGRGRRHRRQGSPQPHKSQVMHNPVRNSVDNHVDRWKWIGVWLLALAIWGAPLYFTPVPAALAAGSPYTIRVDMESPVLRLYRNKHLVHTYPIALGKVQTETPIGSWRIVDKQRGWGRGFGTRWLGLNVPWGIYGIHGTNRPASIGQYASSGCIRMHNADVEALYDIVPIGTAVVVSGDPLARRRRLEYGQIGADVRLVQQALARLGFYHGPARGQFDSTTLAAVLHFQLARKLPVDGMITIEDYRALGLLK